MKTATIADQINGEDGIIKQAQTDAELLDNNNINEDDVEQAREDASLLESRATVESAHVTSNHMGILIEVTATDKYAKRDLKTSLHQELFDQLDTYIEIQ